MIASVISGLVGLILGGAGNNLWVSKPLLAKMDQFGQRLAALEATVRAIADRDRRPYPP